MLFKAVLGTDVRFLAILTKLSSARGRGGGGGGVGCVCILHIEKDRVGLSSGMCPQGISTGSF